VNQVGKEKKKMLHPKEEEKEEEGDDIEWRVDQGENKSPEKKEKNRKRGSQISATHKLTRQSSSSPRFSDGNFGAKKGRTERQQLTGRKNKKKGKE
jgi:hypothetical protein